MIDRTKLAGLGCLVPFNQFHIHEHGDASNCCHNWMPVWVGNVLETSLMEMMQNEVNRKLKESMLDSSFKYCMDHCPKINQAATTGHVTWPMVKLSDHPTLATDPMKHVTLYFNYDKSCNLRCPTCRNGTIIFKRDANHITTKIHDAVVKNVDEMLNAGIKVTIVITGSGDPFASPLFWEYLCNLEPHPLLEIGLMTNGVLMSPERLFRIKHLWPNIQFIQVSVDAATEETYNKTRVGGDFKKLVTNMRELDKMMGGKLFQRENAFWMANFIVSHLNYKETADWAKWILNDFPNINTAWFHLVADWGHFDDERAGGQAGTFDNFAIWKESHPHHIEFLQIIQDPIFNHPKVDFGNLNELRAKFRQ